MDGVFDDEVEQTVTIDEYLKNVEAEELNADLVLGGDEGNECTYNMGYMKRQAIFSCLSCTPDGNAGVCTACSLSCHDGHEIVELWTKRNFRCDCGNSKFGEFVCKLFPKKDVENAENSYNHNFKGLYCSCDRPYPDPDVEAQEEMIQCIMCEDWFHDEHLGLESSNEIPRDEEGEPLYEDFICKTCSTVCSFLTLYPKTIRAAGGKGDATYSNAKDKDVLEDVPTACGSGKLENDICANNSSEKDNATAGKASAVGESSWKNSGSNDSNQCTEDTNLHTTCVLGVDVEVTSPVSEGKPLFLSKNWRDILCRCEKCLDMYNQKHISYLLDREDTIVEYEKMAKQKREEKLQQQEGAELSFFNKLGHIEKVEILNGIADFKDEFRSFLESFDKSKTITSSDVHQIFENLAKKRRRMQ
ncbi:E3 ubiquitin-protein ligase UBR7 isoform X2 [Populus alba x Populus x berolinensis]|uniref:PHD finger family protein n=3 Tax=Populus TaxID=3689 RepID=A0A4U5N851_POPAL|nr:putative E3 ubiquitin-protein ligase UBR7 isoform X2 [Populus alba]KAJ6943640.1 E3 ubiquitin-protein ligase UBR7 isoform X2 [Populus alba x Populus x berolinensis]KAJ7004238.1 E3 ubiquitin-protein ligase UBR7 isoform X2 [Populus alba x Populus x berolinensis]TKR79049.1 PHD finger family protein [Populus alba]